MNHQYLVLRGVTPSVLFRGGLAAPAAAEILHFQNEQMKAAAQKLLEAGLPMRQILMPYVDTVLMNEKTPPFYFGSTMILCGEADLLKRVVRESGLNDSSFTVRLLPDVGAVTRYLSRDVAVSRLHRLPMILRRTFREDIRMVWYTFETTKLTHLPEYDMDYRAVHRAVLAFGDILGRAVRKLGGQVLYCAGGQLICVWNGAEPADAESVLQQTFASQLAGAIDCTTPMKRQIWPTGEEV
ncbi:MAG: hypothetical protein IJY28_09620 [Clostridia bacterium]|nr:hypothetical protein [Clostridia bacterium]